MNLNDPSLPISEQSLTAHQTEAEVTTDLQPEESIPPLEPPAEQTESPPAAIQPEQTIPTHSAPDLTAVLTDKNTIILVADDSEIAKKLLSKILRDLGFRAITTVSDGEQALQTFNLIRPHLVFLDIEMPRIDGLEVLRRMREMDPRALSADFRHSFIAMISAHSTLNNIKQAVTTGANGFIVKPYTVQKIAEMIEKFKKLQGDRPHSLKIAANPANSQKNPKLQKPVVKKIW